MTTRLLRFPGTSFPPPAMTGDEVLDGFLRELDAQMIGGAKVRLLTLLEIKDHLLEARAAALEAAASPLDASRTAVARMGSARDLAAEQRTTLWKKFAAIAPISAAAFTAGVALIERLDTGSLPSIRGVVINFFFFGVIFGGLMTFAHPSRSIPTGSRQVGEVFSVAHARSVVVTNLVFMALSLAMIVSGIAVALGNEAWNLFGFSSSATIALALMSVFNLRQGRLAVSRFEVDREGFWIRQWWGRRRVAWSRVQSLRPLKESRRWLPRWNTWSKVDVVTYARDDGELSTAMIFPDTSHRDRFVTLLRQHLPPRPAGR
jgi:hypothetical protein